MPTESEKSKAEFAKLLAAACFRRGYLESLHSGVVPTTRTGDYSDVRIIDAEGREIPWACVSRINQDEMKLLMVGVVNRVHTFLSRTIFSSMNDQEFLRALERTTVPWVKGWEEPKFLADFLMPPIGQEPHEEPKNRRVEAQPDGSPADRLRPDPTSAALPTAKPDAPSD